MRLGRGPLIESDPPIPNPAYSYGRFKAEVEQWLPEFRRAHSRIDVVVARTCIVIGAHARNIVTHITGWPVMFRVAGCNPPMQFMHEDDRRRHALVDDRRSSRRDL